MFFVVQLPLQYLLLQCISLQRHINTADVGMLLYIHTTKLEITNNSDTSRTVPAHAPHASPKAAASHPATSRSGSARAASTHSQLLEQPANRMTQPVALASRLHLLVPCCCCCRGAVLLLLRARCCCCWAGRSCCDRQSQQGAAAAGCENEVKISALRVKRNTTSLEAANMLESKVRALHCVPLAGWLCCGDAPPA
jgi:hypothetical protein